MLGVKVSGFLAGIGISCSWYYVQFVIPQTTSHAQHLQHLDDINARLKNSWSKIHQEAMAVLQAPARNLQAIQDVVEQDKKA